jgi:hypothetical protein
MLDGSVEWTRPTLPQPLEARADGGGAHLSGRHAFFRDSEPSADDLADGDDADDRGAADEAARSARELRADINALQRLARAFHVINKLIKREAREVCSASCEQREAC